ncbi:hypothetical protein CC2G_011535 [Coprinopsis cinerea AmutBmut pab1-1]|nr:hypothetical protein CC2G_011535 [Coprinopsis cinerea AmutBmut pab1-1]
MTDGSQGQGFGGGVTDKEGWGRQEPQRDDTPKFLEAAAGVVAHFAMNPSATLSKHFLELLRRIYATDLTLQQHERVQLLESIHELEKLVAMDNPSQRDQPLAYPSPSTSSLPSSTSLNTTPPPLGHLSQTHVSLSALPNGSRMDVFVHTSTSTRNDVSPVPPPYEPPPASSSSSVGSRPKAIAITPTTSSSSMLHSAASDVPPFDYFHSIQPAPVGGFSALASKVKLGPSPEEVYSSNQAWSFSHDASDDEFPLIPKELDPWHEEDQDEEEQVKSAVKEAGEETLEAVETPDRKERVGNSTRLKEADDPLRYKHTHFPLLRRLAAQEDPLGTFIVTLISMLVSSLLFMG